MLRALTSIAVTHSNILTSVRSTVGHPPASVYTERSLTPSTEFAPQQNLSFLLCLDMIGEKIIFTHLHLRQRRMRKFSARP